MALRSPIYLDIETLLSQAEYHDIEVPRQAEIVEKTIRKRSGGGKIGTHGVGVNAAMGTDVEYQSSYVLEPRTKATVSKVIDALVQTESIAINPGDDSTLGKDQLVEIEGTTRITAATLAGKMFFILRRLMEGFEGNLEAIFDLEGDDLPVIEQFQQVYLRNELLPIPILLELTDSSLPQKVYVNVRPDHFVDAASANRIEGEFRVLGAVSSLVSGGGDGYLSAEQWLLHDWEYMIRRRLMPQIDDQIKDLVSRLDVDLPAEDVRAYISGPAIVIDAIAIY